MGGRKRWRKSGCAKSPKDERKPVAAKKWVIGRGTSRRERAGRVLSQAIGEILEILRLTFERGGLGGSSTAGGVRLLRDAQSALIDA